MTLASMIGCNSGKVSLANDALRLRVIELERENEQLHSREVELKTELAMDSLRDESLSSEIRQSIPHVTDIHIGRLSHARDLDDDGIPDVVVLYLTTTDGFGRFVQAVGQLSVHAVMFPPGENALTVGILVLEPTQFRMAYRASLTGTHYTIELPIELESPLLAPSLVVNVQYLDGQTGKIRSAEKEIPFHR
ncbi:MAG: hypothetical protein O7G85_16985 [Planctomycetota bacterium]|nr:hypothetical protein [Planctomycetota bacterium]